MMVVGVVLLGILLPRAIKLDQFVTADEHLWLNRSANFYFALGQRDYAVIYYHQWQRQMIPDWMLEYLSTRTPEHTVWINGIEYVRIYKID